MIRIAYITERNLEATRINGAITRDIILIKALETFSLVEIFYYDVTKYHKYYYLLKCNKEIIENRDKINMGDYNIVIISTFQHSPYLKGYLNIEKLKVFYFADSSFHIHKQAIKFGFPFYCIVSYVKRREAFILSQNYCAYLGMDEMDCLPKKYRKKSVVLPFYIEPGKNLFSAKGPYVFLGDYNYKPNLISLKNIIKIADSLDAPVKIYGTNIPNLDFPKNIEIVGYIENLSDVFINARALLYLTDIGTGIKNKVIEAMSYGIPVVGFKEAFTNLPVKHQHDCIILDKLENLVNYQKEISFDISQNSQKFIQENMLFEDVSNEVRGVITNIIENEEN